MVAVTKGGDGGGGGGGGGDDGDCGGGGGGGNGCDISVVILYVSKSYILNVLCDVICHIKVYICHCMLQGSVVHNVLFSVQYCIAKYLSQMLPQDMCHMYDMYTVYTCQLYSI